MPRIITYAFNQTDGRVWSRCTDNGHTEGFAVPVIQFTDMGKDEDGKQTGDFTGPIPTKLEKFPNINGDWDYLTWTKKIPLAIKNLHREFWGMKLLIAKKDSVRCRSGIRGWQNYLRAGYENFEEFLHFCSMYGLHETLGFKTAEECWDENPVVQGSVIPADYRRVG